MSAYTDAWAKATPETPAGFLLRMAGYGVTVAAREKVEQDAEYRQAVYNAAIYRVNYGGYTAFDAKAVIEAKLVLDKKED